MINKAMVEFYKLQVSMFDEDMIAKEYIIYVRKSYISEWLNQNFNPVDTEIVIKDVCYLDISKIDEVNWIKIKR